MNLNTNIYLTLDFFNRVKELELLGWTKEGAYKISEELISRDIFTQFMYIHQWQTSISITILLFIIVKVSYNSILKMSCNIDIELNISEENRNIVYLQLLNKMLVSVFNKMNIILTENTNKNSSNYSERKTYKGGRILENKSLGLDFFIIHVLFSMFLMMELIYRIFDIFMIKNPSNLRLKQS